MTSKPKRSSITGIELFVNARAALSAEDDRSAPAIAHAMLKPYERLLRLAPPIIHQCLASGLTAWARERLRKHGASGGGGPERERQLALWPVDLRQHVLAIGDPCIYLPSKDRFVDVTPDLTNDELNEAGDFRIKFGRGAIRSGHALKDLAAARLAQTTKH